MRTNNSKLISRQYFWDTEIGHGSWNARFSCSLEILRLFISSKLSQGSTNAKKVARCIWFTDRIDATPYVTEGRRRREKEEGIKNFMNFARWTRYNNEISRLILGLFINAPFPKNVFEKFSTNAISAGCNRRRRLPFAFLLPPPPFFLGVSRPERRNCGFATGRRVVPPFAVKWKWYAYQGSRGIAREISSSRDRFSGENFLGEGGKNVAQECWIFNLNSKQSNLDGEKEV